MRSNSYLLSARAFRSSNYLYRRPARSPTSMDPKLLRIIQLIESKKKSSHPWKRQERFPQPYYSYSAQEKTWQEIPQRATKASQPISKVSILSWNIDFMLPFTDERMLVALKHLESHVKATSNPTVIMLQEMLVSDLELIKAQPWVTSAYNITDVDDRHWESGHYGTVTLIPRILPITSVFRVHYEQTVMERDGLFVDVDVGDGQIIRICNTHLESLVADPPKRPHQLATAAEHMHDPAVSGSVLGGDLNAIQPFDRNLHSDNNLQDAYLVLGGKEDSEDGYTWGQMAPVKLRNMFGLSRMDKLYFIGNLKVERFERFGLGVDVEDESVKESLIKDEGLDGGHVTDHLGVKAEFSIIPAGSSGSKI
jgi:tyrosyl-DNA phosphodiesterase 2